MKVKAKEATVEGKTGKRGAEREQSDRVERVFETNGAAEMGSQIADERRLYRDQHQRDQKREPPVRYTFLLTPIEISILVKSLIS